MTRKLRVGVIGAGFGLRVHAPAFRLDGRCEIAAVCASTASSATRAAREARVPKAYSDWKKLLDDPRLDAVTVALPPDLQPEVVQAALRRRIPVFCEKPVSVKLSDARAMRAAAERSRVPTAVDFEFPEVPAWQKAKSMLEKKALGRLRHALLVWQVETVANRLKKRGWKTDSSRGGGALQSFASHSFHYLEWLLGPIEALTARLRTGPGLPGPQDTLCMMRLFFRSGIYANVTVCTHAAPGTGHRLELFGEKGALRLDNAGERDHIRGFRLYHGSRGDAGFKAVSVPELRPKTPDGRIAAVAPLAARFLDAVEHGGRVRPDLADGERVQVLIDAARRSDAASGKAMKCAIS